MHLLEVRAGTSWILVTDNITEKPALTSSVLPWFELIKSEVFVIWRKTDERRAGTKCPRDHSIRASFDYKLQKNIPDRPSVLDKNTLDLGISTVHSPWLDSEVSIAVGSANIEESRVTKSHSSSIASEGLGEISCW